MVFVEASFVSHVDINMLPEGDPISQGRPLAQGQAVSQVPTDAAARRLAERSEHSQGASRLSQLVPCLAPPLEWIKRCLGLETVSRPETFEVVGATKRELSPEVARACSEWAANEGVQVLSCAQELVAVNGAGLKPLHEKLKQGLKGGDGIRRLVTSMSNLVKHGPVDFRVRVGELLDKTAGGLAFSQWGTTGSQGPELFLSGASAESLATAAQEINQIATQVLQLKGDIEAFLAELKKSADPARPGNQLIECHGSALTKSAEPIAEPGRVQTVVRPKVRGIRPAPLWIQLLNKLATDMGGGVGKVFRSQESGSGWGMIPDKEQGFRPMFREDFASLVDDLQRVVPRNKAARLEFKRLLNEKILGIRILDWRLKQYDANNHFTVQARQQFSEWAHEVIQQIEANRKDGA